MPEEKFIFKINGIFFETIFDADHYNDKRVFFSTGAKQFFSIYQILKNNQFELSIVSKQNEDTTLIKTAGEFMQWVDVNYPAFSQYLESPNWPEYSNEK